MPYVLLDCHVHLYPTYDEGCLFRSAVEHMRRLSNDAQKVLLLVERAGTDRFSGLMKGAQIPAGFRVRALDEQSIQLSSDTMPEPLLVIAGRQIATAERLEVLSLCSVSQVPDGLSLRETVQRVHLAGGIPALAWAPGKWFGGRGRLVSELLRDQG
ncbi:MAG: hypothetical protein EBZ48_13700, partial [Proteobacteria bacterium]|nr:hypothetical protein [Pseudomonadota bacterium]